MPTQEQAVRTALATATHLTLNGHVSQADLDAITANGNASGSALIHASRTIMSLSEAHWFKIVQGAQASTEFEFRTYLLQPSDQPDKEIMVRMYALNQANQFIVAPGSGTSIGSPVAHRGTTGREGLSTTLFDVSGQTVTYYFRIKLVGDGTPPSGPYVFLAFRF